MSEKIESYTKYENARMIGSRALQIAMGAPFLIKVSEEELEKIKFNPIEIAKLELENGVLPITVKRPYPGKRD
ncbi:MAG: DNA-directed RNA polymerase subunit K [Candidatus Woesearchaeota archaeon]